MTLPTYTQTKQTITFDYPGHPLQLTVITPAIVRVFENRGDNGQSYAIEGNSRPTTR